MCLLPVCAAAQDSAAAQFFGHNASVAKVQPTWFTPVVLVDPRLVQFYRFSFSNQFSSAKTQTTNYGNGRGLGLIGWNCFEFDFIPAPFIQHNSATTDGIGDTTLLVKARLFSSPSTKHNRILTAIGSHSFATGTAKNGALTDTWGATLAGGFGLGKKTIIDSTLGATLPTGKIAAQGRTIQWNSLVAYHSTPHTWFELENNASYFVGGPHDGKMQNFITPAAFYILRRKSWKPTHPFFVFDCGMQIATSGFHTYNHNLIPEMRVLF
ncbi:MAG: hypothetical protein P4L03_10215 [Terracidiphilus sp.]|nr:hypothetical protein [Terracidiphilus sp.]